ncbi:MAG: hypothetical protein KatS3mg131_3439 [Candidatus Tectimicrobiota bacterium]|nr:MAG: hypothetical protein KatS3mg131_3439 [Candidatus Tectomicrobia bacterium]
MKAWRCILVLLLGALGACSGGGGGGGPQPIDSGGIGGTGVVFGEITALGSIVVNDIEFDVASATVTLDGATVSAEALAVGQVCLVQGRIDPATASGTAESVACRDTLEGPVTDTSRVAEGVLGVLGQTVRVDATRPTVFEGFASLEDLALGDLVEVYGFLDPTSGEVWATRIERKAGAFVPGVTEVEITGLASAVSAEQFALGALTVRLTATTEVEVPGGLRDGVLVEVKGTLDASFTQLMATKVEALAPNPLAEAPAEAEAEVKGVVGDFTSLQAPFTVSGVLVDASGAEVEGTVANGVLVEVEGTLDASGVLIAREVKVERESTVRLEANVVRVLSATSLEVEVGPHLIPVQVTATTALRDKRDGDDALQLADIQPGERVKIRAVRDPQAGLIAVRLEREGVDDADKDAKLRGPVEAVNPPLVTVAGVDIDTSQIVKFEADEEDELPREDFLALLQPGVVVEVVDEGPPDGTLDKMKLED